MKTKILLMATTAALLLACQSDERLYFDLSNSIDAEITKRHAVENTKLRKVMWDLILAPATRLPQELDTDREQKWQRQDAVRILGRMADSADTISNVLKEVDLPESQKEKFRELAASLKTETLKLRADVPTLNPDQIGQRFDALQQNCIVCHQRFRILPVIE
ncbi:MAG: cytochrome c [Limisphaerales bacterium]